MRDATTQQRFPDLLATEPHAWIVANLVFGLLVILLLIWASRHYAERAGRSPLLQWLMRDLAGHNLNKATGFLREFEQHERKSARRWPRRALLTNPYPLFT